MSHSISRFFASIASNSADPSDAELLNRFAAGRDAGAFEMLVKRHAALVLHICRGVLHEYHAAEDATQAVFLALARQAGSVGRDGAVIGWLFRVAHRVAARAARHRFVPTIPNADLDAIPSPEMASVPDTDTQRILNEELTRLPESYRVLVLLCFFEGLTHAAAAQRLGVPIGTVAGRMARAKDLLAARLLRRGVPLSLLSPVVIAVTPSFTVATTQSAVAFAMQSFSGIPGPILILAKQELRMIVAKKVVGVSAIAVAVCGCLAFGLRSYAEPHASPLPTPRPVFADKPPVQKPQAAVVGKAFALAPVTTDLQRRLLHGAGPNSTALLVVDGNGLFKDPNTFDVEALQLGEIRKALKNYEPVKGKSVAHIQVNYDNTREISGDGKTVLGYILQGAARAEMFVPGTAAMFTTYHNAKFEFQQYVSVLKEKKGAEASEVGVGDERAMAYPVQTPLSKMLTEQVAGVVDIRASLPCVADDWIPTDVDQSVKAAIAKLKLAKGQKVNFLFNIPKQDKQVEARVRAACKQWLADGGLELETFRY